MPSSEVFKAQGNILDTICRVIAETGKAIGQTAVHMKTNGAGYPWWIDLRFTCLHCLHLQNMGACDTENQSLGL